MILMLLCAHAGVRQGKIYPYNEEYVEVAQDVSWLSWILLLTNLGFVQV